MKVDMKLRIRGRVEEERKEGRVGHRETMAIAHHYPA